ncbi:fibrinogen [Rothia amarae]|uniref:Fibrinogen n=1 Tax=Rothia amarae TaxID=169480 RepID=A0A7H2BK08_9MICC|nr:fibrinogen-like YCDxxxxGGGW domain-containing protein [Rothia amarae]QNV40004.1 fibrinogen [Rothia amarae]
MSPSPLLQKITAVASATVLGVTFLAGATSAAQAEPAVHDGKTLETAAASCWEIKQNYPNSPSGAYWLAPPNSKSVPGKFYCDQETDGGGWLMIGRGREDWNRSLTGKGDANKIWQSPSGKDAFTTAQLSAEKINELTGKDPNYVNDIRVVRSLNDQGNYTQELRGTISTRNNWIWALPDARAWRSATMTESSGWSAPTTQTNPRTTTKDSKGFDRAYRSFTPIYSGVNGPGYGYAYGIDVKEGSADSHIWLSKGKRTMPFTQMYLRPKLTSPVKPEARKDVPKSLTMPMLWRTSEQTATGVVSEMHSYVQAITQVSDTVFVGGDYKNLVSAKGEVVEQPYLSGYNVNTGDLVRTFMPKFNGQIKAVEALPSGKLVVGGEFTEVNGKPISNLVVLNPATGEVEDLGWKVENRGTSGIAQVRSLDVQGNYLYVGGNFTHTTGATSQYAVYAKNAVRFDLTNNSVDKNWKPVFNGTVSGISAAEDGQSVFAAGYFSELGGKKAFKLASINTTDGAMYKPWEWKQSIVLGGGGWQLDVQDAGNTVWAGGTEHFIHAYDKNNNYARTSSAITKRGGDFQDLHKAGNIMYGACHCGDQVFDGAYTYFGAESQARNSTYGIKLVGAWDITTGKYIPDFAPNLKGASGNGVWESFVDSRGNLWVGGDINQSLGVNGPQKTVGFARFEAQN